MRAERDYAFRFLEGPVARAFIRKVSEASRERRRLERVARAACDCPIGLACARCRARVRYWRAMRRARGRWV